MTHDIDEMLGASGDGRPKNVRRPKTRANLGKLHNLLTAKLPDFIGPGDVCDLHKLAKELAMTYQGVYKWTSKEELPFKQVKRLIALSQRQKLANLTASQKEFFDEHPFEPATEADFYPFIS